MIIWDEGLPFINCKSHVPTRSIWDLFSAEFSSTEQLGLVSKEFACWLGIPPSFEGPPPEPNMCTVLLWSGCLLGGLVRLRPNQLIFLSFGKHRHITDRTLYIGCIMLYISFVLQDFAVLLVV